MNQPHPLQTKNQIKKDKLVYSWKIEEAEKIDFIISIMVILAMLFLSLIILKI